jgi:hypothetical protein
MNRYLNKGLKSRVVGYFVVYSISCNRVVGYIFHICFSEIEGRIEHSCCNRPDSRMLFSLDLVEFVNHSAVVSMQLSKIMKNVRYKCIQPFSRDNGRIRIAKRSHIHLKFARKDKQDRNISRIVDVQL